MKDILCRVERLSVTYRTPAGRHSALKSVSLDIKVGEKLAIIGESGSGKSTLALALTGLLPAEAMVEGDIVWTGRGSAPLPGRDIGIVFQDPGSSLNPVLTIGEQVGEGARHHLGLGRKAARDKAIELLARVRLPHPEQAVGAYPHQFSGGQRQRIAIAAAIAAGPSVLIADEATSALDTIVQAEIAALLEDLVQTGDMTLIFVTHDIGLAASLADRIAVFRTAELVEFGDAGSIVNTPQAGLLRGNLLGHPSHRISRFRHGWWGLGSRCPLKLVDPWQGSDQNALPGAARLSPLALGRMFPSLHRHKGETTSASHTGTFGEAGTVRDVWGPGSAFLRTDRGRMSGPRTPSSMLIGPGRAVACPPRALQPGGGRAQHPRMGCS